MKAFRWGRFFGNDSLEVFPGVVLLHYTAGAKMGRLCRKCRVQATSTFVGSKPAV